MKALVGFLLGLFACVLVAGTSLASGDCSDYVDLSGQPLPITVDGTTVGATNDYGPFPSIPDKWLYFWASLACAGPDVTYKWTAPETARYTISLFGSSYNTGLLLYNFTCPNEPTYPDDLLWGNDNAYDILQSEMYGIPLSAGQEILIVVDGYATAAGSYRLTISQYAPPQTLSDLDTLIESRMEAYHFPGVSAVAARDGEVVWSGNYGHANIAQDITPADSTLFGLASISKTVVGVALMQLWERGLFGLDDDVNLHLPWPVRNPSFPNVPITMRMVMTHTSSIRDSGIMNSLVVNGDSSIPLDVFLYNYLTPGGSYYYPQNFSSVYAPGTLCSYCSSGAALAGYLVQCIDPSGRPLEDYCQQEIFGPLGMDESSWFLANLDPAHIAIPYRWAGSSYVALPHTGCPYYPADQLRTSSSQLIRLALAVQRGGELDGTRILNDGTVDTMLTVHTREAQLGGRFGLLWLRYSVGGRNVWGHWGAMAGRLTAMFFCPEENTGAVILTNGEAGYPVFLILHDLLEWARTDPAGVAEEVPAASPPVLYANYPNPFNNSTSLRFYLPAGGVARLEVYDVTGRRVARLGGGRRDAGFHMATWTPADAVSGIYYAKLEAGGARAVRRLLLIR